MKFRSTRTRGTKTAQMLLTLLALGMGAAFAAPANGATIGLLSRPQITRPANDNDRVVIPGNMSPFATTANDRGRVADGLALDHMQLLLQRPADREAALQQFMKEQTTPGSANYHKWLTAEEFGTQYGVSQIDINTVTGWLTSHGFTVNKVYNGGTMIHFSGTAGASASGFLHRDS